MKNRNQDSHNSDNRYSLDHNDFLIRKTSRRFILSSVASMIFLYAGSLIDTLLVGKYLGDDGLAAMSIVSPVYLVYYTIGATIGIGASINASRALGRGEIKEYRSIFTLSCVILAVSALVMTVLGYVFIDPITDVLCSGVTGSRAEMAKQYLRFYIPGGAMTLISYIPLYFLKTEGKPKYSSRLFLMSAIINVVLSWLLMSPAVGMGTAGAALATSVSFSAVAVAGFILLLGGETELGFEKNSFNKSRAGEIVVSGIPNGVSNLLESGRIFLINTLIVYIGASAMLTCYTVVRNVNDVLNAVIIGLSSALIPLIGVFFGERNYDDERMVFDRSMRLGLIVTGILTVAVFFVSEPLCRVFGVTDPEIIEEGKRAIPLSCIGLTAAYANTLYISYLTAIKREGLATTLVALRLFVMLAVFVVPLSLTVGVTGIWMSLSLCEIATLILFFAIRSVMMRKDPNLDKYLLDVSKEHEGDISFVVKNNVNEIVKASEKINLFCEDNDINMKLAMRVSLAIEEVLTFLLSHCLGEDKDNFVEVRVCKLDKEVMVRFRYVGEIYDPMDYYNNNQYNEELAEELLGLKMITKSAAYANFQQTLGTNNLIFTFQ